ncbi:MAG: hypothetical protein CBE33_04380 [Candidatus Pelagibacter sp. TMED273]|nr:MAG: hypothetical protein CBE33_04380 [Candidatus Pelagibacter sp. TMED273]|tara:strand:- start:3296 stop:3616 length:321 start_codon:yes stop_codon:yes gene_type:complete
MNKKFNSFKEFYPFYLSEHKNSICRLLHFIGSFLVILTFILSILYDKKFLLFAPIFGYGFAWIGHFYFEKNKPATFKYPIYSFMGDWMMFKDILIRKEYIFNPKEG